jgi:hypothetical protein
MIPMWLYYLIESLKNCNFVTIDLIVINKTEVKKGSFCSRLIKNRDYHLYTFFMKFEKLFFHTQFDPHILKNSKNLLEDINILEVFPEQTKFSDRLNADDITKIKEFNLDVLIRFGFRILRGDILSSSKYGVWSLHHGDQDSNRGGPAGFWEVLQNQTTTGTILQILTEDLDDGEILSKSISSTDHFSVIRNRSNYFWNSPSIIIKTLQKLYEEGEQKFFSKVKETNQKLNFYDNQLYTAPKNKYFFKFLLKHFLKLGKEKLISSFYFNQWILLFYVGNQIQKSFWKYKEIIPPKDRFWADPHIISKDDTHYIFLEEYIYKKSKGHIALMKIDKNGKFTNPVKILEKPYHLSYPFVFYHENELFMVPESSHEKTIQLYKCDEFPLKWTFQKNLLENIIATDSTLFFHNNKWWLFASVASNEFASSSDELCLFYSDNLLTGTWTPHPMNPIISDVRKARPAGKIFEYNGNLYRPSQNCSVSYGYGLVFNKISRLNETEYEESQIISLEPNWKDNIVGFHTFNYSDGLSIIDAKKRRLR